MSDAWTYWPAPAKLNLFLHIVGRREDGYHLLQTAFQLLDRGDEIALRTRTDGRIERPQGPQAVPAAQDLVVRAASALRERCATRQGADIRLDKRIPIGAGLGGGSSDAATVLVALNELWSTDLTTDELAEIGLGLGADVPLFVRGHSAWAEGIGERLTPITLPQRHYVVVDPRVHVSTRDLFSATELTRNSPPSTISGFLHGTLTANAFAPVVRARYPAVAEAMDWLANYGQARLSGSGGCVFVALDSAEQAEMIVKACPETFRAFRATGVNRSGLLDAVGDYRSGTA